MPPSFQKLKVKNSDFDAEIAILPYNKQYYSETVRTIKFGFRKVPKFINNIIFFRTIPGFFD